MRGHFDDESQYLSTSSDDDDTNAAVNIQKSRDIFEAVNVHTNTRISGAQRYRRAELEHYSNNDTTTKNSPLFVTMFKISFILLTVSIILLIGIFFFYPDPTWFSGGAAASNNDIPILIIKDSNSEKPSLSPLENTLTEETAIPTFKPSMLKEETEIPTSGIIREPIQINIPQIIVNPTLSPISSAPKITPTSKPTTLHPTRSPTKIFPTSAPTSSSPTSAATRTSITFYVLGDIPYDFDEELILSEQILGMPNDAEFVFHVGDIMRPKLTYCMDGAYDRVKQILLLSKVPVFITMGDNDWIDCPDQNIAMSYWKNHFHKFDRNWRHTLPITRQNNRKENVAWVQEKILFMSVHIVGGDVYDPNEWITRLTDDVNWVNYNINRNKQRINVVVIFGHSKPKNNQSYFFEALANISNDLGKPMLYIHGDGHKYYMRRVPFYNAIHIVDVQVDQGKNAPPLKVTVHNDATNPYDVFEFDRRMSSS